MTAERQLVRVRPMYTLAEIHDAASRWLRETRRQERRLLAKRQPRDDRGRFLSAGHRPVVDPEATTLGQLRTGTARCSCGRELVRATRGDGWKHSGLGRHRE